MYFKQIELTGFKSFADRTILRFNPGITAIVGPNGCGKSNILDALRWVLGEQRTKELRGSQMQDVIFNGSENRLPLGMSEVSVLFDNSDSSLPVDFSEVQVTRRLYRSGESEYLINKVPCRLRDVQELFMDTGVGAHGYSLVGQGKMDLVLSQRPEDRRFLFEEAAGILKYKNRKRVALRRLDSAEQNLLRLTDIIAEIERQLRSLKRQANAAIRYRELSEQLRRLEIRAAWLAFARLKEQLAGLRTQFTAAQDAHESLSAHVAGLEARREQLDLDKLEVDRELMARREAVYGVDAELEKLESQIALLKQEIGFSRDQQRQAAEQRRAFEQRARALEEQIEATAALAADLSGELTRCTEAIAACNRQHEANAGETTEAESRLDALRVRVVEGVNRRARTQTELEALNNRIQSLENLLGQLDDRQRTEGKRRDDLLARRQSAREDEAERRGSLAELETRRTELEKERSNRAQTLAGIEDERRRLREAKSGLDARLSSLRELRDNYEGFAAGVRAVMRARESLPGIIGPAGDLIAPQKAYERAIEAALGGNINNVFIEDADSARKAVEFLVESRAGRVTFLPLDIIRSSGDSGEALQGRPGIIGPAINYVQFDPRLTNAVEYLLHGTVIVETLEHAITIARKESRFPRLVTRDGEVVSPAGAITGGRTKHDSRGILGRSAEIRELEEESQRTQAAIDDLAQRAETLGDTLRETDHQRELIEAAEQRLDRELGEIGVAIARLTAELDGLDQALAELAAQRGTLQHERDQLQEEMTAARARADLLNNDDKILQGELDQAHNAAQHARLALEESAAELGRLRVREAGMRQRIEELERERTRLERELDEVRGSVVRCEGQIVEQQQRQEELESGIRGHLQRSSTLSQSKEEARAQVVETENRRQRLLDETETVEGELRTLRERVRQAQAEVHRLELEVRSNDDRLGFLEDRIRSEYQVSLGALGEAAVGADEYDDQGRERLVSELRERLARMGEVNVMAIEEYETLEKRHAFLFEQAEDLRKAREALLGVIARSDRKIREMFLETFVEVGSHFREYFRSLFNGGQARIYLLDEDDPLESGIEIEARPPGKKPTTISLLSGGESSMTAIALLFAILKAKPTPFSVLDEVDASLDDANIGRFLAILDEFAEHSQFLVITHNKGTMQHADALYGVTMQERGVSQIISARLEDFGDTESAA